MTRMAGADGRDERPRPRRHPPRDRDEAERGAHQAADAIRLGEAAGAPLHDGPVPERLRAPVEEWAGTDLSHVRLDGSPVAEAALGRIATGHERPTDEASG